MSYSIRPTDIYCPVPRDKEATAYLYHVKFSGCTAVVHAHTKYIKPR